MQEEIQKQASSSEHDVTPITMALTAGFQHTRATTCLQSMLSRNSLNPADIVQLHKLYTSTSDPPPVDLIRIPQFLELLIDALFKPGSKINQEHKSKYIYLLGCHSIPRAENSPTTSSKQINHANLAHFRYERLSFWFYR